MSGPIVRRYGFPNFERIFGKRPLEHGTDEVEDTDAEAAPKPPAAAENRAEESKGQTAPAPERKPE
jgi:hypothetical protein